MLRDDGDKGQHKKNKKTSTNQFLRRKDERLAPAAIEVRGKILINLNGSQMKDLFAVYLCEAGGMGANLQGGLESVRTRQKEGAHCRWKGQEWDFYSGLERKKKK